jgi:hypothetical protein
MRTLIFLASHFSLQSLLFGRLAAVRIDARFGGWHRANLGSQNVIDKLPLEPETFIRWPHAL